MGILYGQRYTKCIGGYNVDKIKHLFLGRSANLRSVVGMGKADRMGKYGE
jgi:hypothetical protein